MEVFKTHGAFSWSELITSDPAAAATFYGELFGWRIAEMGPEMGGYRVASIGDNGIGGIMASPPDAPPMPPHWGCYVTVDNLDTTLAKCESLGGKTIVPAMDVPNVGRMAVIVDPQGAALSLMQYLPMPG
jgi:predicted enzyme related to lactoylglutathione lyase